MYLKYFFNSETTLTFIPGQFLTLEDFSGVGITLEFILVSRIDGFPIFRFENTFQNLIRN